MCDSDHERSTSKRPPLLTGFLVLLLLPALVIVGTRCQWREGDTYWITRYDACVPDADGDCEADDGGCANQPNQWIGAEELYGLLESDQSITLVDVRAVEYCNAYRIPGASCNPWDGDSLADPIDLEDGPGWLIFYDGNGEDLDGIEETLPQFCDRIVSFLTDGFVGWAANEEFPIERD